MGIPLQRRQRRLSDSAASFPTVNELLEFLIRQDTVDDSGVIGVSAQLSRLSNDRIVIEATVNAEIETDAMRSINSPGMSVPLDATIMAAVADAGETCLWGDVREHADLPGTKRFTEVNVRSVISTPFHVAGTIYFLSLFSFTPHAFDDSDRDYVERLGSFLEKHLFGQWQAERIRYNAAHDSLTGLINRQRFRSAVRTALTANAACFVAVFDLAGFRSTNERVGDMVGDALLVEVGSFLASTMRFGQTASRLGGDVFGVCVPGFGTRVAATTFIEPLLNRFNAPFSTGDRTGTEGVALSVRVGVALFPSDGTSADKLLARAYGALDVSKKAPPGRIAFFEPTFEIALSLPGIPKNESERLSALRRFEIVDSPPEPAFDRFTRLAAKLLRAPMATISFIEEHRQWFKSEVGVKASETPRDEAFCSHVINEAGVVVVYDAANDPRFRNNPLVAGDPHIRFYAGAPLVTPDGLKVGAICVMDDRPRSELSVDDAQTLIDLAALVMGELSTRRSIGYTDPMTQLPNQVRLRDDLDAFINDVTRGDEQLAVVTIDMAEPRRYDELVRTLGHGYSEKFVLASARLLRSLVATNVKLYHVAQYRFAVVLSGSELDEVESVLSRLAEATSRPILCGDIEVATNGTVDISRFPTDARSGVELLRAAISATQEARDLHRGWAAYNPVHDSNYRRAFQLLSDLPSALAASQQLWMAYQPKIDLLTGRCAGVEALARWNHPEFGAVSPSEFVSLAERTGIVRPLTDWVLRETIAQVARWQAAGINVKTAINISMLDLEDIEFSERLRTLLDAHHVPVEAIELELTESALVLENSVAVRELRELQRLGIDIAIDDFGTGQSAHGYLKRIPAKTVKIDQSFVRAVATTARDQMIVGSMIDLAHGFGYQVVAEGVETQLVSDWLETHDCDFAQGYLYVRPLDAVAFERWLTARAR